MWRRLTAGGVWEIERAKRVFCLRAAVLVYVVTGVAGGRSEGGRWRETRRHEYDGANPDLSGYALASIQPGRGNGVRHLICR